MYIRDIQYILRDFNSTNSLVLGFCPITLVSVVSYHLDFRPNVTAQTSLDCRKVKTVRKHRAYVVTP